MTWREGLSRRSDRHDRVLDHVAFHGVLVELAKLWGGVPMRGDGRYGPREWQYLSTTDAALHDYALNLARGFPKVHMRGGMPRR